MKLAKIIGNLVATRKTGTVDGLRLLIVQYLDDNLQPEGKSAACIDTVGANTGDLVLLCASSSARMTRFTQNVCTDATIVGIIDSISAAGKDRFRRE